ncbi:MAG: protein phosphatase 2C domain-containing protein [Methylococcales bacterium]|nr:protein phosphatase 2C domain-containing protein [Methylococcales bacterium]
MKTLCAAKQLLGHREKQEDTIRYLSLSTTKSEGEESLLLLADGMGGHVDGEKASQLVVQQFIATYQNDQKDIVNRLQLGLAEANNALATRVSIQPELKGMGTTLLVAHVNNKQLHWVSVGDSPLWLYRNETLIRLNQDHSMASVYMRMAKLGEMTEEAAKNEPLRHSLRSVLNGKAIALIDAPKKPFELLENDILLLASDGIETLTTDEISAILQQNPHYDMALLTEALMLAIRSKNNPIQDNTSIIAYKVATLPNRNTKNYASSLSWASKNLNLLIIIAFGLGALFILLLLQFNFQNIEEIQRNNTLEIMRVTPPIILPKPVFDPQNLLKKNTLNATITIEDRHESDAVMVEIPERFNQ